MAKKENTSEKEIETMDKAEEAAEKAEKKAEKKADKKKAEKKQPGKIAKWFKDLKIEFKKVIWPTKQTVITNTSVVLAVVAGTAIFVGLIDTGFLALMRLIYG